MFNQSILTAILGLSSQWLVTDVTHSEQEQKVSIKVRAKAGALFSCPVCGKTCVREGEREQSWRNEKSLHLHIMLTARVPTVSCEKCGINRIVAPWERPGTRFVSQQEGE